MMRLTNWFGFTLQISRSCRGRCPSVKESIQILSKKLSCSHKDNEQELFGAMLDMLKYMDKQSSDKNYFFGTEYFERVWEGLIDKAFGIKDKSKY